MWYPSDVRRGSSFRAWIKVGTRAAGSPFLRFHYMMVDRVAWSWWWYTEVAAPDKFPPYRVVDRAVSRAYAAFVNRTWDLVYRSLGE